MEQGLNKEGTRINKGREKEGNRKERMRKQR